METINDAINLKLDVVTQQKKEKRKNVMNQWTETILSLAIQIGLSDNRHAAILSRTFPPSKAVQSVTNVIFIQKFMARISAEISHGFLAFPRLLN
jgi:hypothetical protein